MKEEKEQPRLYSRQQRVPVDVVAADHLFIHADLDRWGAWNRERYEQGTASSIEGSSASETGGREVRRPTVCLPPDPKLRRIEEIVVQLMQYPPTEQHGETLREFYCKRWPPKTVCWAHALKYEDFATWMYDCRQAVLNLLI